MEKGIAISKVDVSYEERLSRILIWDVGAPVLITSILAFIFWKYVGPYTFAHLFHDFGLSSRPKLYYALRTFCYEYMQYVGVLLGFLIFGVTSFNQEVPPGPGRLVKVLVRRIKKRSELRIDKQFEDLSHPASYDFKAPSAVLFSRLLKGS